MSSLSQHNEARNDPDLLARFVAAAEIAGIPNAQAWVEANRGQLVAQAVAEDQTVSDVYAYAVANYPGRPGEDATKVTDSYIQAAVSAVNKPQAS